MRLAIGCDFTAAGLTAAPLPPQSLRTQLHDVSAAGVIVTAGGPEPEPRRLLNGISDVRAFFHTNNVPLYFISPTPVQPARHRALGTKLLLPDPF
jgi:hypothetical protein